MSESVKPADLGQIAATWWQAQIGLRDSAKARALAARLRRAGPVEALCEPAVQALAQQLRVGPAKAEQLARIVCLLAEVRENDSARLANRLGGGEPLMSNLRFQRLLRAEDSERVALLRRAVLMADRRCNVAALARDVWTWSEAVKMRWCFDYFGADAPFDPIKETTE